jgi:hypothetical protein
MLSVLADRRKLTPFVTLKRKNLLKEKLLTFSYLNMMSEDGRQKNSWLNG